jgi:hypothetical protein
VAPRIVNPQGEGGGRGGGVPTWVWYAGGAIAGIVIIFFVLKPGGSTGSGTPITQGGQSGGGPSLSDLLSLWAQAQQNMGTGVTTNPPGGGTGTGGTGTGTGTGSGTGSGTGNPASGVVAAQIPGATYNDQGQVTSIDLSAPGLGAYQQTPPPGPSGQPAGNEQPPYFGPVIGNWQGPPTSNWQVLPPGAR